MIQATLPRRAAPQLDLSPLDLNQMARDALKPWADAYGAWNDAYGAWADGASSLMRPMMGKQACGCQACRSDCCKPDPCGCRCCIADCDLLVEARIGERRIIPITIENHWRRARDIDLELSSWTKLTDTLSIRGEILTADKFTIPPCGEAHVVLGLTIGVAAAAQVDPNQPPPKAPPKDMAKPAATATQAAGQTSERVVIVGDRTDRLLPDVDHCAVSYADLRIAGCDLRSIRIAVAVLPRDCDAYVADCYCTCC